MLRDSTLISIVYLLTLCIYSSCSEGQSNNSTYHTSMDSVIVSDQSTEIKLDEDSLIVIDTTAPPLYNLEIVHDQTFPEHNLPRLNYAIDVVVDQGNRVAVTDPTQMAVNVYTGNGSLIGTIGRKGRGPGEFTLIGGMFMHEGLLAIYGISQRIQQFSTETLELEKTLIFDPRKFNELKEVTSPTISYLWSLGQKEFLVGVNVQKDGDRHHIGYYRMNEQGEVLSQKLFETVRKAFYRFPGGSVILPFSDEGMLTVSQEANIFTANSSEVLISATNLNSGTSYQIYYPFNNYPLHKEIVLNDYFDNYLRSRVRNAYFPDRWPAIRKLLVDNENRIWLSVISGESDYHTWIVFGKNRRILSRFDWPQNREIALIRDNHIYDIVRNQEEGVFHVERHRVMWN